MPAMRFRSGLLILFLGLAAVCLLGALAYQLPPVNARLAWRVDNLRAQIRYALNPPERDVFVPSEGQALIEAIVQATLQALRLRSGQVIIGRGQPAQVFIAGEHALQKINRQERAFGVDGCEGVAGAGLHNF